MKNILGDLKLAPKGGLTTREFLLVVFLIIAVEGYLLYAYILQPAYIQYDSILAEKESKQVILDGLVKDYARKDEMEKEIISLESEIVEMEKQIPSYLSQEEVILFLENLSIKNRVEIQATTFSNAEDIPLKVVGAGNGSATETAETTQNAEEPESPVTEQLVSVNYVCNYQDLYNFIKDIENNVRKVSVNNIILQKGDDGMMSGQMNLSFISYWNESVGQKPYIMTTDPISGKTDPFKEYTGYSSSGKKSSGSDAAAVATVRPDFYLMINSYLNNSSKTLLMNYYNKGSEAAADTNGIVSGKMTINGQDGNYTYQYNFGDYDIVEDSPTLVKDGKIRMEVLVQPRRSEEDKVGVMMDITNNTDVPFEITVKGDDEGNPRFVRGRTTGTVTVKQVK